MPATVMTVQNIAHHGKYSTWYTADIGVTLHRPVGGTTNATVHDPAAAQVLPGETISVLVDPDRPSYAELPGSAYGNAPAWIILAALAAIMLFVAGVYGYELTVRIRQRRLPANLALSAQLSP